MKRRKGKEGVCVCVCGEGGGGAKEGRREEEKGERDCLF